MNSQLKSGYCKIGYSLTFWTSVVATYFSFAESLKDFDVAFLVRFVSAAAISI